MRTRVLVWCVCLAIGAGCKKDDSPPSAAAKAVDSPAPAEAKPTGPFDGAAAKAFLAAEADFQKTAKDGPPEAYAAAAKKLDQTIDPLIAALGKGADVQIAQLSYVGGVLENIDAGAAAQPAVRLMMAQKCHDHLAGIPVAPLPYPSDPALAKEDADALATAGAPHGDFAEAIGKLKDEVTAACACTDRACLTKIMKDVDTWGSTYGDLDTTPAQDQQLKETEDALIACAQKVTK